jgi:hypothetical protein
MKPHPSIPRLPKEPTLGDVHAWLTKVFPSKPISGVEAMDLLSSAQTGRAFQRRTVQKSIVIGGDGGLYNAETGKPDNGGWHVVQPGDGGLTETDARMLLQRYADWGLIWYRGTWTAPEEASVCVKTADELREAAEEHRRLAEVRRDLNQAEELVVVNDSEGFPMRVKRKEAPAIQAQVRSARLQQLRAQLADLEAAD